MIPVTVAVRHCEVGPDLRERAEAIVQRLAGLTPFAREAAVVFDAVPQAGQVEVRLHLSGGKFLVASREEASSENEMNTVAVEGDGTRVIFKQIAGLIARRIVFRKRPGDTVNIGERVGLIKFGSRVDVLLGPEWEVQVREGERVAAGSSVLARRKG